MNRYPRREGSTHPMRSDPEVAARVVNAAWGVTRDRLAREDRDWSSLYVPQDADFTIDVDARLERIEAAMYALFRFVDEVDDLARYAVEVAEAA